MNNWTNRFKQAVLSFLTITMAITGSNTIGGAGLATAVMIASSSDAEARTVRGSSRSRTRTTSRGTTHRSVSHTSTHRHTAVRPVAAPQCEPQHVVRHGEPHDVSLVDMFTPFQLAMRLLPTADIAIIVPEEFTTIPITFPDRPSM